MAAPSSRLSAATQDAVAELHDLVEDSPVVADALKEQEHEFEGTVAAGELERTAAALLLDLASTLDCGMLEGLCLKKEYLGK